MKGLIHPKCGKTFADSSRTGHCSACCQTFFGLGAFDSHQPAAGGFECIDPTLAAGPWWQDSEERWHYGKKLTEEEKARIWPQKEEK